MDRPGSDGPCGLADDGRQRYELHEAVDIAERRAELVSHSAYVASAELAAEKSAFPVFDRDLYLAENSPPWTRK